jgi:hypothetical protein
MRGGNAICLLAALCGTLATSIFAQNPSPTPPGQNTPSQATPPPNENKAVQKKEASEQKKNSAPPKQYPINFDKPAGVAINNDSVIKDDQSWSGGGHRSQHHQNPARQLHDRAGELIALKAAGVSDKVIAAMAEKSASGHAAPAPHPAQPLSAPVKNVGVYYKNGDAWTDLAPEVVNFKTGGVFKSIGTAGIVKGDVNGHINGEHSRTELNSPIEILVYTPEGTAINEYQLLRLRPSKDSREFRTVTGGVLHVSGGATRDLVPFESSKPRRGPIKSSFRPIWVRGISDSSPRPAPTRRPTQAVSARCTPSV